MKKKLTIVILSLLLIMTMTACNNENIIDDNKSTVVCTGFAQYDWVMNILGEEADNWNVIRINDKGADMHSYQPSAADMILINKADLLIYTGGMSEEWIEEAIESQDFKGKAYALLENAEPICMEEEHGHGEEDHDHEHEHDGHSHDEYDEHIWLSLGNAIQYCHDIENLLNDINPSKAYSTNCQNYTKKLMDLDKQFEGAICGKAHNEVVFADRFPFRYLARDYGLEWYAAFPGCSAETEASFDTIKELTKVVKDMKVREVFVTETGDDSLAKTVIANSGEENIEIIEVNSMQSIAKGEARGYIEIMEDNLEALKRVLQ